MGPVTKWVLALIAMLGIGFVALDIIQESAQDSLEPAKPAAGDGTAVAAGGGEAAPGRSRTERAAHARQLVTTLVQIDVRSGTLTQEKADLWRRDLLSLLDDGTEAVPPIAEFLQKRTDVRFDVGPGTNLLGDPTLRIAFIKVLFDIPTPDNVDLQKQVLGVTTDPDEVVLLARQLDMQEPGHHREAIVNAARASLESVRRGEFPGRDARAVAELLKRYQETVSK